MEKSTHPWLTHETRRAISKRDSLENTEAYVEACADCIAILAAAYTAYVAETRRRIASLSKGSKQWCRLNRELLDNKSRFSGIPSLRNLDASWIHESEAKTNAFADTFSAKCVLPPDAPMSAPSLPGSSMNTFCLIRMRWTNRMLASLRVQHATGPDGVPARVLKECADILASPLTCLIRLMISAHFVASVLSFTLDPPLVQEEICCLNNKLPRHSHHGCALQNVRARHQPLAHPGLLSHPCVRRNTVGIPTAPILW